MKGVALEPLFKFFFEDDVTRLWGKAFRCVYSGPITLQARMKDGAHAPKNDPASFLGEVNRDAPFPLSHHRPALRRYCRSPRSRAESSWTGSRRSTSWCALALSLWYLLTDGTGWTDGESVAVWLSVSSSGGLLLCARNALRLSHAPCRRRSRAARTADSPSSCTQRN